MNRFLFLAALLVFSSCFGKAFLRDGAKTPQESLKELSALIKENNKKFEAYARAMESYKKALADVQESGLAMQQAKMALMSKHEAIKEIADALPTLYSAVNAQDSQTLSDFYSLLASYKYDDFEQLLKYDYAADFLALCHHMRPLNGYFPDKSSLYVRNVFDMVEMSKMKTASSESA